MSLLTRFFGPRAPSRPLPLGAGTPRGPAHGGAVDPSRSSFPGLTERDVHLLYKLAPTRQLEAGEPLLAEAGETIVFVVATGSLELAGSAEPGAGPRLVLQRGHALRLEAPEGDGGPALHAVARERSTLLAVGSPIAEQLSSALRFYLDQQAACSAGIAHAALAAQAARLAMANDELVAFIAAADSRRQAIATSPAVKSIMDGIPALPVGATRLATALLSPDANANEVVELLRNDPAIAGLVLKTVNSVEFGLRRKITDYYHAFVYLGTNNIYHLVMDAAARGIMPDTPESRAVQTHAYVVSLLCSEIATLAKLPAQLCSTVGILHDIGRSVGLVLRQRDPNLAPLVELLDSAHLGGELLASWGIPDPVPALVRGQREPEYLPPGRLEPATRKEALVLHLARLCAGQAMARAGETPSSPFVAEALALLGLGDVADAGELYRGHLLPSLTRQRRQIPASIRTVLGIPAPDAGLDDLGDPTDRE